MVKFLTYLAMRLTLFVTCSIDRRSLKDVPFQGPMIFIGNHINFLDVLTALAFSYPRKTFFLVKKETFDTPFLRLLFNAWGGIAVDRGTADLRALRKAAGVLGQGHFFTIAPEGTRTKDGQLIKAQTGVVIIALKSKAAIMPVAQYGGEKFSENIKKLRRTRITMRTGAPFMICPDSAYPNKSERQLIADEMMYQIAELLPPEYRGYYSDLSKTSTDYLDFNLPVNKPAKQSWRQKAAKRVRKYQSCFRNTAG